jgi:hypothetical protein
MKTWLDCFRLVARRKVGGGDKTHTAKTDPADEMDWHGIVNGKHLLVRTTIRSVLGSLGHFVTNSGMRCRDSFVDRHGHFVDVKVRGASDVATLEEVRRMAQAAEDSSDDKREVRVRGLDGWDGNRERWEARP